MSVLLNDGGVCETYVIDVDRSYTPEEDAQAQSKLTKRAYHHHQNHL
jgi:hypothetical protein